MSWFAPVGCARSALDEMLQRQEERVEEAERNEQGGRRERAHRRARVEIGDGQRPRSGDAFPGAVWIDEAKP